MSNLVRANYEFWSENQVELSFRAGDVIKVLNRDDAGWWEGELQGKRGLFPSNYVEPYTAINNYRAGAQQQEQQLRWGNNNNNQQQGGWNNNNNRGNGGGSTVGTGSHVGSNAIYGNNNNGNNCNNNNNRNNNNNNNNNNRNNNNNNNNNWSNNNRNNNNGNNWNNNANNNNHWNNNYNNNNNNWNNNNNNNNNNWDHRSNVSENQNMKKPTNLDTYNSMMNNGNNYQQQPPPPQQQQQPVYGKAKTIEDTVKKPLAASSGPDQARAKVSSTKFGVWASALGDITGMTMIGVGFCGMLWGLIDLPHFGIMYVYTGIYSMVMGVFVYAFERSRWGQSRGPTRVPWRAICYLLISIFCFFSLATLILGLCCVVVAGANIIATVRGEVYDPPETSSTHSSNHGYFSNLYQYLISFREQNKIGVLIFNLSNLLLKLKPPIQH